MYGTLNDRYPNIEEHPMLASMIENMDGRPTTMSVPIENSSRKFFVNEKGDRIVQMQSNRILINWRKETIDKEIETSYPHFVPFIEEFRVILGQIENKGLSFQGVEQYEMTFIDHLYYDELEIGDFEKVNILNLIKTTEKVRALDLNMQIFDEPLSANIYFRCQTVKTIKDSRELLRTEITCRGFRGSDIETVFDWYNEAHDRCVELFVSLLSEKTKSSLGLTID